jgi:hypothetical protein
LPVDGAGCVVQPGPDDFVVLAQEQFDFRLIRPALQCAGTINSNVLLQVKRQRERNATNWRIRFKIPLYAQ